MDFNVSRGCFSMLRCVWPQRSTAGCCSPLCMAALSHGGRFESFNSRWAPDD